MKPKLHCLAAVIAAAGTLHAQPGEGMPPGPPPVPPVIAALDVDGDRTISAEEIEESPEALASLDEDGDGQLTREELRPGPPDGAAGPPEERPQQGHRRPHGPPPVVAVLDDDRDGIISAEEIANAPAALAKLDKNGDGELTRDELRPRRRPGGPPQGRGEDGQGPDGERRGGPRR